MAAPRRKTAARSSSPTKKPVAPKPRSRQPRATRPATPRQAEILTFIRDYTHKNGYSPTYDEIADQFGISKVTVFEHLTILEERGLISREKHKARSLHLSSHLELPDERPSCVRLLGRIAAGNPIEAVQNPEVLDLEQIFTSPHGVYALQVRGDSMIDDHIEDGDFVVVEDRKNAYNGEMVVARLPEDDEVTLKRFYREKGKIRLQPANEKYEPIFADNVDVQGVVIGVVRRVN